MNSDDIYVMPAFVKLSVRDLDASSRWYRDVLGFFVLFEVPGQLVHLRREKYQDILLKPSQVIDPDSPTTMVGAGISVCFSVAAVDDVDQLAESVKGHNAQIVEGPVNQPWNVRELVLHDPDGFRTCFEIEN